MRALLLAGFAALAGATLVLAPLQAVEPSQKAAIGAWGVDTAGMSKTIKPGDDFYRYVNETWLREAKIPQGLPGADTFTEVALSTEQRVGDIITKAREGNGAPGTPEAMIADFHRSHANMDKRNALGLAPIASTLATVGGLGTRPELGRVLAWPWMAGPIAGVVGPDADDPKRQIATIAASGLSMPARDYYLNPGEPFEGYRKALLAYIAETFRRAGFADAEARAAKVFGLEMAVAKNAWNPLEERDVVRMNHVMTSPELNAYAPGFPWDSFLAEAGFDGQTRLKVITDTAVRANAKLFADTPVDILQSYLVFHTLDSWAPYLSDAWVHAHFDFHKKTLMGVAQRRTAVLETVAAVNSLLGEEIGRIYVAGYFGANHRAQVQEMVNYLQAAFRDRIEHNDWMDAATRKEALAKLDKVSNHIGFPDRWHDRSSVRINPDDLVGNMERLIAWEHQDGLARLAEGTRPWEFGYPPQEVNAGYSPARNSITFPAGILQPPFFDSHADPAVNFGAIAAVIGHEIGHAFDDQGSRSDGDGRLRNWWTPAARAEFEKRTAGLVE
jgi:putative endopeptidase